MPENRQWLITLDDITTGLTYYFLTTLIVLLGIFFGLQFVREAERASDFSFSFIDCFTRHDGLHYRRICTEGYTFDPYSRSEVAFFPAYPLIARSIVNITGLSAELSLIIIANTTLGFSFVLLSSYLRMRFPDAPSAFIECTLLSFGVFPTTFFFRMAYSEGLFLLLLLLVLLAMERRSNLILIALLVGLATATRPVGVALVAGFLVHVWQRSPTIGKATITGAVLLPISCWGLLGYMAYQLIEFKEPLAFITTQDHWRHVMGVPVQSKYFKLLMLEPIWGVLEPTSPLYWKSLERHPHGLFSLYAANPVFFCAIAALILYGICKKYLTTTEAIISAGLLLIPYFTKGYDNALASGARFASVVVPAYWVLGLSACHTLAWRLSLAISSALLGIYTAMFAAAYVLI